MGKYLETVRSAVPPWECDVVEHFTVAYYFDKIAVAGARLLDALGRPPAASPRTCSCFVRYASELRAGDIYLVESAVIESTDASLRLGHRFIDAASGEVCTTVEQELEPADRLDTAAYGVVWEGPAREQREPVPPQRRWHATATDVVRPREVDWKDELALEGYVHRFSAASAHLQARFGMTPSYQVDQRVGFSTFEMMLVLEGAARSGEPVEVLSCVAHIGRTSLRFVHRMQRVRDGRLVAELSQLGVHLDKDARRPARLPEALVQAARALE